MHVVDKAFGQQPVGQVLNKDVELTEKGVGIAFELPDFFLVEGTDQGGVAARKAPVVKEVGQGREGNAHVPALLDRRAPAFYQPLVQGVDVFNLVVPQLEGDDVYPAHDVARLGNLEVIRGKVNRA
jgi:hypothetical protein